MANNKVIYDGTTLIDLTSDTVTPDTLLTGATAHDASGAQITGTATGGGDLSDITTNINGLLKGAGGKVTQAEGGTDYATPDDTKAFVVTFTANTGDLGGIYTSDKTLAEIFAAYNANKNVIGRFASGNKAVMGLTNVQDESHIQMGYLFSNGVIMLDSVSNTNNLWAITSYGFMNPPSIEEYLPDSGDSLYENTIYNVSSPVGTYVFTPPASGWAHGKFTTGSSVSVSFSGTFMGAAPAIEANKTYEFDVYNGVWAVQEVVSA